MHESEDFIRIITRQKEFSEKTFGPGKRDDGIIDHIKKELIEIKKAPGDLEEWIDVIILALDGAWRNGFMPGEIVRCLNHKQAKNESRTWPDWRTAEPGKAIEHVRDEKQCANCKHREKWSYQEPCKTCFENKPEKNFSEWEKMEDEDGKSIK